MVAVALVSNIGDRRQTMNTPAVTIVAAWISAETGVGPSIASGSQVWRPSCADLPIAPTNSSRQIVVITSARMPRKPKVMPAISGAAARIAGIETVPNPTKVPKMPTNTTKTHTTLQTTTLTAATIAQGM